MLTRTRESASTLVESRYSVMDTLLLRPSSDAAGVEYIGESSPFGYNTPYAESNGFTDESTSNDPHTVAVSPRVTSELKTPTTRAEQLELLLARNYNSAPACSLEFVNRSLSIKVNCETECGPELSETVKDEVECEIKETLDAAVAPLDSSIVHILRCDSCNKETMVKSDSTVLPDECISLKTDSWELSTEANSKVACALLEMHNASEAQQACTKEETLDPVMELDISYYPNSVDIGTSPPSHSPQEDITDTKQDEVTCCVDVSTSPIESAKKSIPVYSRSLLYRIRVPLAQRLRNACSTFVEGITTSAGRDASFNRRSTHTEDIGRVNADGGSPSAASSTDDDEAVIWSSGIMESTCQGYDFDHDVKMDENHFFRKKRRPMYSYRHSRRQRRKKDFSPNGLIVEGELWHSGSMRNLGPKFNSTELTCCGDKMGQLSALISRHINLCSEAKRPAALPEGP